MYFAFFQPTAHVRMPNVFFPLSPEHFLFILFIYLRLWVSFPALRGDQHHKDC